MKPNFYYSDDYAGLATDNAKFYYGYETQINEEWCFTAEIKGFDKIVVPFSRLKADDQWECVDCLMVGIGWILTKYKLMESQ